MRHLLSTVVEGLSPLSSLCARAYLLRKASPSSDASASGLTILPPAAALVPFPPPGLRCSGLKGLSSFSFLSRGSCSDGLPRRPGPHRQGRGLGALPNPREAVGEPVPACVWVVAGIRVLARARWPWAQRGPFAGRRLLPVLHLMIGLSSFQSMGICFVGKRNFENFLLQVSVFW